jgi:hypothetical protein
MTVFSGLRSLLVVSVLVIAGSMVAVPAAVATPPLEILDFTARSLDSVGDDYTVAGGHPYDATTSFSFPHTGGDVEHFKSLSTELPPGFVGNVAGVARCTIAQLAVFPNPVNCPAASAIGVVDVHIQGSLNGHYPVYNVVPEHGYPAQFAFAFSNKIVQLYPRLRSRAGQYGVTVVSPDATRVAITGIKLTLFGVPSQRGLAAEGVIDAPPGLPVGGGPPPGGPPVPFLSNPSDCLVAEPVTNIFVDSWFHPARTLPKGSADFGFPDLSDPLWKSATAVAPPVTGCDAPALVSQFAPSLDARPSPGVGSLQADAPTGFTVDLDFPQSNDPTDTSSAFDPDIPMAPALKDATVTLPEGVSISPSAGDGLDGCSDQAPDDRVRYDTTDPVSCPDASKIGSVVATSPLLAKRSADTDEVVGPDPIAGDVFVLKPHPGDLSPSGDQDGRFRLLIQVDSREQGVNVKIPGVVTADEDTGRLTARFEDNPQLPVKHLKLVFKPGARAALANPPSCATATTSGVFTPWSRGGTRSDGVEVPGTPDATDSSSFDVSWDGNGAGCPESLPFAPAVSAGTVDSRAGASSPFTFDLTRGDRQDIVNGVEVALPRGLLGAPRNVTLCSDADANAGSCPPASRVGSATVAAGPGSNPFYIADQPVSLTGPYKGAPYGLAIAVEAKAGPFDLGTVVVRQALHVDPTDAHATAVSDPLPTIRDGVPFRLRRVHVAIDRPGFMRSPTSCAPKAITSRIASVGGKTASLASPFRASGCAALPFKPKIALALTGRRQTTTGKHPGIKATVTQKGIGEAGIQKAVVRLPKSLALDPDNAQALCEFEAGTKPDLEKHCPKGSIVGRAKATTPLLKKPLAGNVYFVKNVRIDKKTGNAIRTLPMLVVALRGEIAVNLKGESSTTKAGKLVNTFASVPDAPISQFNLNVQGGSNGILAVTRTRNAKINLCSGKHVAEADFDGQNGRRFDRDVRMKTPCTKKQTKAAKRSAKRAAAKARN